ncbi:hypothetical protein BGW39_003755, partial [Mortierella sp. 14UC]
GFMEAALNPTIPRENWEPRRLKQALDLQDFVDANPECDARALTVVNTGNHWAVLVFDFKRKRMLFGDSMDKGKLNQEKHASVFAGARLLLESCYSRTPASYDKGATTESDSSMRRIRVDEWIDEPLRFPVPQQQDSSSCGFAALNAIEHSIHPSSELWSNERKGFFRVKYLMYATSTTREAAFDGEPSHLPRAGLIGDGMACAPVVSKYTGVTFKEQMCEGRDEPSATDRATAHAPSHVVAKQDTPNDHTAGAMKESIVRPVKKEAIKQKSGPIASKEVSKNASSSAGKLDPVKHK